MQLKAELQERDQDMLCNNVEKASIPDASVESAGHIVLAATKKLGLELEERDIVSAARAGPARVTPESGSPVRLRPIVIRLARRIQRDAFLRAARVRRGASTSVMGVSGTLRPFYVNERLT